MAIEIVDFPINSMVDLSIAMLVHQRVSINRIHDPEIVDISRSCSLMEDHLKTGWDSKKWMGFNHGNLELIDELPSGYD